MQSDSSEQRNDELTICTVSFHNARHIALNWELAAALNKNADRINWIVAENTPAAGKDRLSFSDPRYRVVPGAPPNVKDNYHHTEGLHRALELVTSRYLLILDPDFYIVRENWWEEVRAYLGARRLAFFGSPWHPKFTDKYRYFPAVHCMFIDLAKVSLRDLDFSPWPGKGSAVAARINSPPGSSGTGTNHCSTGCAIRRAGTRVYLRCERPDGEVRCPCPVYRFPKDYPGGVRPSFAAA
jgi:hypothetical protein